MTIAPTIVADTTPMPQPAAAIVAVRNDSALLNPLRPLAWWRSFRMQTALLFGGLSVVFCGAVAFAIGNMLADEIRRETGHVLQTLAQSASRTLANGLAQRLLETQVLADSPTLWADGLDAPAVDQAINRMRASQPYNAWIGVADVKGRVMAASAGMLLGQSVQQRPWFTSALHGSHVGDVHRALLLEKLLPPAAGGEPIRFVDFAAPIRVNGKIVGVLGAHGTWDWAREVINSLLPEDAVQRSLGVFIFDRAGKVLYAPVAGASGAPSLTLDALRPAPTPTAPGTDAARVVRWPDGQDYLTTVVPLASGSPVTDMGWQIVAREPVVKAFARASEASRQAFAVGLALSALAALLAWLGSGMLTRSLTQLAASARDVRDRVPGAQIPILQCNREVHGLSTAFVDLTHRLEATYRTAPIGMCQTDADGLLLSMNDRLADILGIPAAELLCRRLADLIAARDHDAFAEDWRQLHAGRLPTLSRELTMASIGTRGELSVALTASRVPATELDEAYFIVVVEDISQRMAAEAATRANVAKTAFLSQVSHELRTPLNAVLGFGQLMTLDRRDPLSPKQASRAEGIVTAGRHLLAMINDLLDLTQIESDRMCLSIEPVLLSVVLEESVALLAEAARAAQITLEIKPPASSVDNCVQADQVRLRQVIVNLLSNAVKYNRKGGTLGIAWGDSADGQPNVRLTVTDSGVGIAADKLEQLFQPFNRLGAEATSVQGTGIGLVITRKLVEMMNGRITVTSTQGVGSTFSVTLPRATQPSLESLTAGRTSDFSPLDMTCAEPRCVMYVEDNEVNIEILTSAIEFRPNLRLIVARSGEEALRLAATDPPDMFLLDMHLGDMTGADLAAQLKSSPEFASLPLIAVSADATPEAIRAAHASGFTDYLSKPINLRRLLACLDEATAVHAAQLEDAG